MDKTEEEKGQRQQLTPSIGTRRKINRTRVSRDSDTKWNRSGPMPRQRRPNKPRPRSGHGDKVTMSSTPEGARGDIQQCLLWDAGGGAGEARRGSVGAPRQARCELKYLDKKKKKTFNKRWEIKRAENNSSRFKRKLIILFILFFLL